MISPSAILHGKVLIVDDQEANVLLLEQMLRSAGYVSVTSTMNPGEVCALHSKNCYDLILLDLQMPGMDGFQVMENLKEIETGGYLPILVITAQPRHQLHALESGAKDFITKPFAISEVLARVRNMLEVRLLHKELHNHNDVLEQRVREKTTDLQESYRKLQQLALHLDNVREKERERIARELHDEMGSTLTALKMSVHWLASKLPVEMVPLVTEAKKMGALATSAIHTMRQVVSQLMPTQLHDVEFAVAAERYVQDFQNRLGIKCELSFPDGLVLDMNRSSALFRILQESLNNIAKHSQATEVRVALIERSHSLILLVKDNGVGFDKNEHKNNSFGLIGIRQRAMLVNGKARINSNPGRGAQVVVSIPYERKSVVLFDSDVVVQT